MSRTFTAGPSYSVTSGTVSISTPLSAGTAILAGNAPSERDTTFDGVIHLDGGDVGGFSTLYPEMFTANKPALWFHISIWEKIFGETYCDYAILAVTKSTHDFASDYLLVFGSKRTRQVFRRWWRKYNKLYDDDTINTEFLPCAGASKRIKGAIIRFKFPAHKNVIRDVWAWIVANSRARVWRVPDAFVFANDVDAVAFKLKWC